MKALKMILSWSEALVQGRMMFRHPCYQGGHEVHPAYIKRWEGFTGKQHWAIFSSERAISRNPYNLYRHRDDGIFTDWKGDVVTATETMFILEKE